MIPGDIYQTWKTKELPPRVQACREMIAIKNPSYTLHLFDDYEMDSWMTANMPADVVSAYNKLNIGAAKADLWRYCILYKQGGVYLDIDSDILVPLYTFISPTDQAVISRENNEGRFLQWLMAFIPGHPILERAISIAVKNIESKVSTNVAVLTGPHVFTDAVNEVMLPFYFTYVNLWYQNDQILNEVLNTTSPIRCKFMGFDFSDEKYGYLAFWKSEGAADLYTPESPHWLAETKLYK